MPPGGIATPVEVGTTKRQTEIFRGSSFFSPLHGLRKTSSSHDQQECHHGKGQQRIAAWPGKKGMSPEICVLRLSHLRTLLTLVAGKEGVSSERHISVDPIAGMIANARGRRRRRLKLRRVPLTRLIRPFPIFAAGQATALAQPVDRTTIASMVLSVGVGCAYRRVRYWQEKGMVAAMG